MNSDVIILNALFNHKTFSIDVLNKKTPWGYTALDRARDNRTEFGDEMIDFLTSKKEKLIYSLFKSK